MSFNDRAPSVPGDSDILNHVMRMVIPMRREHNRSLEVRQFMHDLPYAKEIIDLALVSKDLKLVENGAYLSVKMFGPRGANEVSAAYAGLNTKAANIVPPSIFAPTTPATPSMPTSAPMPTTQKLAQEDEDESEAQMRARMMSKYKNGLR